MRFKLEAWLKRHSRRWTRAIPTRSKQRRSKRTLAERWAVWLALLLLAGCSSAPPVVPSANLVEYKTVEVPVPVIREPPADLAQPLDLTPPTISGTCAPGDYAMSRAAVEQLIEVMRTARERLQRWRAWAR